MSKASMDPDLSWQTPQVLWVPAPKHSAPAAARISQSDKASIQRLVQGKKFPFHTESDFIRAAIHYFLQERILPLDKDDRLLSDELHRQATVVSTARLLVRSQASRKFTQEIREAITSLMSEEAYKDATAVWWQAKRAAEASQEPFREKVLKWLREGADLSELRMKMRELGEDEESVSGTG